jgi:death on curing protein
MTLSNVLDPIHTGLSPHVWDEPESTHPRLKKQHAKWIKRTIFAALTQAGYTDIEKWLHLVLTGSLTTYQYSEGSDCDISLFVDTKLLPEWSRSEMIAVMVGKVDGTTLPGTPFPMQDFVVPGGLKPEDLYKPGLRSGYDLDTESWIVPPEPERVHDVQAEENGFYVYALQMADKMESLLKYEPDKAVTFWHQIHKRRQVDQKRGKGDFAESNIIYKFLANRGLFPKISEVSGEYIAKTGMAADSDWIENWIKQNGPYLYHGAHSREGLDPELTAQKIEREGILPNQRPASKFPEDYPQATPEELKKGWYDWENDERHGELDDELEEHWLDPRPDHVFLTSHPETAYGSPTFRVDLRKLDPTNLNPDDDWMRETEAESNKYQLPPKTLGEEAQERNWGVNPEDTHQSLENHGVIGHRGPIPPEAIERIAKTSGDDLDPEPPSVGYRFHSPGLDDQVRQHGFQPVDPGINPLGSGVYFYDYDPRNPPEDVYYPNTPHGKGNLYQIDLRGLENELQPDYELEHAWHHPGPIPPERIRRIAKTSSPPTEPPNYRHEDKPSEKCGNCKMQFEGKCWGYGNKEVEKDAVCDSWASDAIIDDHESTQTNSAYRQSDYPQTPQVDAQAQIEPQFPDINNAVEVNKALLEANGQTNHALLRPDVLGGALGRAANQWHYTGSMANAAAAIAHGVGQAQAFEDGNKRTAYWLTQQFLRQNGYPEAAPDDDEELADHLIGYGENTHSMDDTARMFTRRPRISKVADFSGSEINPQEWLHEKCADYAWALRERNPSLRLGDTVTHAFAHDDKNAYDALGTHPLPYGNGAEYNIDPEDFDERHIIDHDAVEEAHRHIEEGLTPIRKQAAWSDHFVNSIEPIAQEYGRLPMYDPEAAKAWQALANDSMRRAAEIGKRLNVQVTDDPEPYPTPQHMFDDINKGNFVVSRANSEHPIWTPEQNVAFRTVHDVEGHHPTGGDFGWQGENLACGAHFGKLDPEAQRALMTECLGQTGAAIHNGGFGPQKVGFMDSLLRPAQEAYNPVTPQGIFSSVPDGGFSHRHIRHGVYRLPETHTGATRPRDRQVAKFVYHPVHNRLVIGEMGNEEGEKPTHAQLASLGEFERPSELTYGAVKDNGYMETYGRGIKEYVMNPYQQQYRAQEAVRHVLPEAKFTNEQRMLDPSWALPGPPHVVYAGQPPVLAPPEENAQPPADWEF